MAKVKTVVLWVIGVLIVLIGYPFFTLNSIQGAYLPSADLEPSLALPDFHRDTAYAARLSQALQWKTISHDVKMVDHSAFEGLGALLRKSYPHVFAGAQIDTFSEHSYLLHLGGNDNARNYLFIAHQDVVPVDSKSLSQWDHPPFSGTLANGNIYGRGTLDDKSAMMALLEGLEHLLSNGWTPTQNLYLFLGQDEEVGGTAGAKIAAAHCLAQGIHFDAILDEGGIISTGAIPGMEEEKVALIGTAEKGYLSVKVTFDVPGGHSSMPEKITAVGQASAFVDELHQNGLLSKEFSPSMEGFFAHLAPEMPWPLRTVLGWRPITNSLLLRLYSKSNTGRALTSTTAVATMISGGIKDNVVPYTTTVVCNSRLLPGQTEAQAYQAYEQLANKYGGKVQFYHPEMSGAREATTSSSWEAAEFQKLGEAVKWVYPEAHISPYLTIGGTDSKHFQKVASNTYRFLPVVVPLDRTNEIHGNNEHITVSGYHKMIAFYTRVLVGWCQ